MDFSQKGFCPRIINVANDDDLFGRIKVLIDSYDDKRSGFEFAVNPDGSVGRSLMSLDPVIRRAITVDATGGTYVNHFFDFPTTHIGGGSAVRMAAVTLASLAP